VIEPCRNYKFDAILKPGTAPFELGTKPGVNRLIKISLGYVILENCPQQK
jgi:hypothetical protein